MEETQVQGEDVSENKEMEKTQLCGEDGGEEGRWRRHTCGERTRRW